MPKITVVNIWCLLTTKQKYGIIKLQHRSILDAIYRRFLSFQKIDLSVDKLILSVLKIHRLPHLKGRAIYIIMLVTTQKEVKI